MHNDVREAGLERVPKNETGAIVSPTVRAGSARERLCAAAVDLFSEHGVSGTSLQMIADRLGVTKAAVYHQFNTKEEIVLAIVTPALERLSAVADAADAARSQAATTDIVIIGFVDLMIDNRQLGAMLSVDPTTAQVLRSHPMLLEAGRRIDRLVLGPDPTPEARVRLSMLGGSLMAAADPKLADIDVTELRGHMLDIARRIIGVRRASS